jgi:importin subunit alpha-2
MSYLCEGESSKRIQSVVDSGACEYLVILTAHSNEWVQAPALRCVGNIVSGEDTHTDIILKHNALPILVPLLASKKHSIRKEVCWIISNMAAGTGQQAQNVINANALPLLVGLLSDTGFDVRKEAAWAIDNLKQSAPEEMARLVPKHKLEQSAVLIKVCTLVLYSGLMCGYGK